MGAKRSSSILALLLGVALACGDDAAGPSAEELTGTWEATRLEYVSVSAPVQTVDLIADGGSATLVLAPAGTYTFTIIPDGEPQATLSGTWESGGDVLTMTVTGASFSLQFALSLSGDTLRLSGADAEYDFDGDDVAEPARLNLVLTR
jgi:hypothetical protein